MKGEVNLLRQRFILAIRAVFIVAVLILFSIAITEYRGEAYVYLIFSIASNGLIYFAFRKDAIFFDTFIGLFFWLGFWLKFSRVTYLLFFMPSSLFVSVNRYAKNKWTI